MTQRGPCLDCRYRSRLGARSTSKPARKLPHSQVGGVGGVGRVGGVGSVGSGRWAAATSAMLARPGSTRRTSARPRPSSRTVATSSAWSAHAASYSRRPPSAGPPGTAHQHRTRTGWSAPAARAPGQLADGKQRLVVLHAASLLALAGGESTPHRTRMARQRLAG